MPNRKENPCVSFDDLIASGKAQPRHQEMVMD
jgi:hypothetical protein